MHAGRRGPDASGDRLRRRDDRKRRQRQPLDFFQNPGISETGQVAAAPGKEEIRDMLLRHARLQVRWRGEYQGIREMRKHLAWYTAGLPHSAALRNDGNQAETLEDFCGLIQRRW